MDYLKTSPQEQGGSEFAKIISALMDENKMLGESVCQIKTLVDRIKEKPENKDSLKSVSPLQEELITVTDNIWREIGSLRDKNFQLAEILMHLKTIVD